jgi:RNA polymerase sigma-70 factor (ECF subfamily)
MVDEPRVDSPGAPFDRRRAVEDLLAEHQSQLRAFIRLRSGPMLRALESPSDLAQSVCREILQHHERLRTSESEGLRHWLYTTAARKIANRVEHWRAQKRDAGRVVPLETGEDMAETLHSYGAFCSPSANLRTLEEVQRIEAAFDALPEDYRDVITLHRVAGLSIEEVALRLDRSPGATRMLLFRALARLAELLDEDPPGNA